MANIPLPYGTPNQPGQGAATPGASSSASLLNASMQKRSGGGDPYGSMVSSAQAWKKQPAPGGVPGGKPAAQPSGWENLQRKRVERAGRPNNATAPPPVPGGPGAPTPVMSAFQQFSAGNGLPQAPTGQSYSIGGPPPIGSSTMKGPGEEGGYEPPANWLDEAPKDGYDDNTGLNRAGKPKPEAASTWVDADGDGYDDKTGLDRSGKPKAGGAATATGAPDPWLVEEAGRLSSTPGFEFLKSPAGVQIYAMYASKQQEAGTVGKGPTFAEWAAHNWEEAAGKVGMSPADQQNFGYFVRQVGYQQQASRMVKEYLQGGGKGDTSWVNGQVVGEYETWARGNADANLDFWTWAGTVRRGINPWDNGRPLKPPGGSNTGKALPPWMKQLYDENTGNMGHLYGVGNYSGAAKPPTGGV